jgi:energy-coupling factor transport system permease protein
MDARGFDSGLPRTVARPQRFGPADALLIIGSVGLGLAAVAASARLGTFRPLW